MSKVTERFNDRMRTNADEVAQMVRDAQKTPKKVKTMAS